MADPLALAARIHDRLEPWWEKICTPVLRTRGDWSMGSDRAVCVHGAGEREVLEERLRRFAVELRDVDSTIDVKNAEAWLARAAAAREAQLDRYQRSRREGTDYHRAFERILANQNPATFDYAQAIGLDVS